MRNLLSRSTTEVKYILRFLSVGVLNTCVGLGSIYACKYFLGMGDVSANMTGYIVGITNSFFWNRKWTFSYAGGIGLAALRFLIVFLVAYAANLTVALALIHALGVNSYIAHAIATIPYTVIFYIGSRYFVFTPRSGQGLGGPTVTKSAQEAPP